MPFDERCKVKIGHDLIGLSGDAGIRLVESDEQFLAHAVGEQLVVDILHDQESGAGQFFSGPISTKNFLLRPRSISAMRSTVSLALSLV